ncbi:EGF plus ASC domain ion channel [Trichostrongylus colubriformis]|uniref:EGF plus ASC domain ion channel n=1 Tax=Trichostrongylus colubriformis TaxID=6319 RepID=A0AAN8J2F5_TRICO
MQRADLEPRYGFHMEDRKGFARADEYYGQVKVSAFDPNACDDRSLCNVDLDRGVCVDTANGGHMCKCNPAYTGSECQTEKLDPCTVNFCSGNSVCVSDRLLWTSRCECNPGYTGNLCQYEAKCANNPCMHGGTCVEKSDGKYECECLEFYSGTNCETINKCEYANECVNGKCVPVIDRTIPGSTCTCDPGYEGPLCDQGTDECASMPCLNGTCTDLHLDYNCTCFIGVSGKNCDINVNDCVPYKAPDGKTYPNRCVTRDAKAECEDGFDAFTCVCSPQWTGEFCDLNALLRDVLVSIYGRVDLEMLPMLEDLLKNPSQIKDMVPFIIGLQEGEAREDISWDYNDLFYWAAFEEKPLILERDLHKWNDVVLGNCFTFNHRVSTLDYKMRSSGVQGGLQVMMSVGSYEYAPWFDTAAILVFVHNKNEYVFSESVRYSAQPDGETLIQIRDAKYTRLAGKYGVCVKDPSEVDAYYYDGMYTTDGCLRSCYQDMILRECQCMDPRYPVAPNTPTCVLAKRQCIDDAVAANGDPSDWESCVCPLPCSNQQYSVEWHRTKSVTEPIRCLDPTIENCTLLTQDAMLITITLPRLEYHVFGEVPSMDLNRFISNLGGLLGVLMGVCILSFIEVAVLIFRLICIMFSKN